MPLRKLARTEEKDLGSIWLICFMAISTALLRLSILAANMLLLWSVYGLEIVRREHLRITNVKPEVVVSNGDVLYGTNFRHYALGVGIWLMSSILMLLLFYKYILPGPFRRAFDRRQSNTVGAVGTLWAVGLFFLVPGILSLGAAMTLALLSLLFAMQWAWRLQATTKAAPSAQ